MRVAITDCSYISFAALLATPKRLSIVLEWLPLSERLGFPEASLRALGVRSDSESNPKGATKWRGLLSAKRQEE